MKRPLRNGIDPLRYARSFLTLVDEMHFGRAARELNLAQPSLSEQIARLEDGLGFLLFERTGRGINLTPAGIRYAAGMREAVSLAGYARECAESSALPNHSAVRVGFVSAAIFRELPRAMRRFGTVFPSVEQSLVPRRTMRQIDELKSGALDIACVRGCVTADGIVSRQMTNERLFAAVPASHRLAERRTIDLHDLRDEPLVSFHQNHAEALASVIDEAWSEAGGSPMNFTEANDWPAIIGIVNTGAACSVVPQSVTLLRMPGVKYLALRNCRLRTELCVAYREGEHRQHVRWLVDTLGNAA